MVHTFEEYKKSIKNQEEKLISEMGGEQQMLINNCVFFYTVQCINETYPPKFRVQDLAHFLDEDKAAQFAECGFGEDEIEENDEIAIKVNVLNK